MLAAASVSIESSNEGLPPRSGDDLRPLTELHEGSEATRPPSVAGERIVAGLGLRGRPGGGGSDALPPGDADVGGRRAGAEAGEAEATARVG